MQTLDHAAIEIDARERMSRYHDIMREQAKKFMEQPQDLMNDLTCVR